MIIAGGSDHYAGCLAFNALAALRSGADLAITIAPRRAADIVAGYSPDLITVPCHTRFPDPKTVIRFLNRGDSLVIGDGVERTPRAHRATRSIIHICQKPIVADAEALHALAFRSGIAGTKRLLLTPNIGEYEKLAGEKWPTTVRARLMATRSLAQRYRATVIVKGALDFISDGIGTVIDKTGSPYMTKGGYGDLLAGVAGALLARGYIPFDAAKNSGIHNWTRRRDRLEKFQRRDSRERSNPSHTVGYRQELVTILVHAVT